MAPMTAANPTTSRSTRRVLPALIAALLVLLGAPRLTSAFAQQAAQAPSPSPSLQEQVRWTAPPGLAHTGERMGPEIQGILAEARAWSGIPSTGRPIELQWVAGRDELEAALGHPVPRWFAAVAVPSQRRMVIAAETAGSQERLRVTLRHELMHLVMADLGDEAFARLPAWFHEGCAEDFAGDIYLGDVGVSLSWRALAGSLESLSDYREGFGRETYRAAVGYALGHAFVRRLKREHGANIVAEVLALVQAGASLDAALVELTGLSVVTHEQELREELASLSYLVRDIYSQLFLVLALFMIAAFPLVRAARRRRRRELEERWERQDRKEQEERNEDGGWQAPNDPDDEEAEPLDDWVDEEW